MAYCKIILLVLAMITVLTITQAVSDQPKYNLLSSSSATLPSEAGQYHEDNKNHEEDEEDDDSSSASLLARSRRLSRFLAEKGDKDNNGVAGRGANNCEKVCKKEEGKKKQCCNNNCVDQDTDSNNCGGCGKICKYTETCCKGNCVDLSVDKTNCGTCHNRCPHDRRGYVIPACVRGMCNYA